MYANAPRYIYNIDDDRRNNVIISQSWSSCAPPQLESTFPIMMNNDNFDIHAQQQQMPLPITAADASRPINILSLDGGGMRGLILCQMLQFIESYTQQPINQLFDMIVGTSTGAILGSILSQLSMDCATATEQYKV